MVERPVIPVAAAAAAMLSACGESNAPPPALAAPPPSSSESASGGAMAMDATCSPSGTSLAVSADKLAFDTGCLAAPADRAVTVRFDNREAVAHNLSIYSADPMQGPHAKVLFRGELITGPRTVEYSVGALPAGAYHFHCDLHPTQMFGTYVVK